MQDQVMRNARYGIWGEPVSGRTAIQKALPVAEGVSSLFGRRYENALKEAQARNAGLDAQEKEATMQGRIGATNTKNETDIQMYPQMQQAKLQQEQQTINEIMARTGLSRAQASAAAAHAGLLGTQTAMLKNPLFQTDALLKAYEESAPGSKRKLFVGNILDQQMSGLNLPTGKGGKGSATTMKPSGELFNWEKDPRMGSRLGGAGGTYIDPKTGQVVSTDTNAQASRDQRAIAGAENVKDYLGKAILTLPQFQTAAQKGAVGGQKLSNFLFGTNYEGPSKQAEGEAAVKEAAEGFINTFGLNATNENVNKAISIMTPKFGESSEQSLARMERQLEDFKAQEQRAKDRLASGNPVGQAEPQPLGYFTQNALSPEQQQQQQQQAQYQAAVQQLNQLAQQAIDAGAPADLVNERLQAQLQQIGVN